MLVTAWWLCLGLLGPIRALRRPALDPVVQSLGIVDVTL
jgi:hypothetical protein